MRVAVALIAILAGMLAESACAQNVSFKSGDDRLDALVADISAGKRDGAIARISSIESLSGERSLATTPSQFVDRLSGCRPDGQAKDVGFGNMKMIQVVWACSSARYVTVFDTQYAKPYITVGNFEDEAVWKARLAGPRVAPPMPPLMPYKPGPPEPVMSDADNIALMKSAFSTLMTGDYGKARDLISSSARITFGRRDPVARVTIVELEGVGPDAFVEQGKRAVAKMGKPVTIDCVTNSCRFAFSSKDRILIVIAGVTRGKISNIQYLYAFRGGTS